MSERNPRIVVAGDATVDWFFFPVPACDAGQNWQLQPAAHAAALPGGVLLLAEMIRTALRQGGSDSEVLAPPVPDRLTSTSPEDLLHSSAMLESFEKGRALRVRERLGFIGPATGRATPRPPDPNPSDADLIVLDDAGNGFRDEPRGWPQALSTAGSSLVVHKLHRPLDPGPLWERIRAGHSERHVLIVRADDLRCIPGVDIACALSWERTAKHLVFQLQRAEPLLALRWCPYLIVLFGTDGAVVHYGRERPQATLVFDPTALEGSFAAGVHGEMHGLGSAFTAALSARLAGEGLAGLEAGVGEGLAAMRRLLQRGFKKQEGTIGYPLAEVFTGQLDDSFQCCRIPPAKSLTDPDPDYWRVLDQRTRNTRPLVAEEIVQRGRSTALAGVPVGAFGKLRTIDRAEIESYSGIRELIREFLANPNPPRPLCFAVFGPPGAGKSFGVKQVVDSLGAPELQTITFNISQFGDYGDLVAAFHQVRNIGLRGQVPFVFFDEFDAASSDGPLGWLKAFLAPMQDGEFKEAGAVHPIGRAIFVFAGGTRSTFEEFAGEPAVEGADGALKAAADFKAAKGPDFVSRLRGFINVMGPNPQHAGDAAFLIRRAMVLRSMLERNAKAKGMFDSHGRLRIDGGVLRALLHVGRYRHGTRSMEAILDMSRLAGRDRFDLSALPPLEQLSLHVDADEFQFLTRQERFIALLGGSGTFPLPHIASGDSPVSAVEREHELIESAARILHDDYVRQRTLEGKSGGSTVSWDEMSEEKKQSNRDAAADIPQKLRAIGHGLRTIPSGKAPQTPDVSDEEIERMAQREHARWCAEQRLQGFTWGPERDPLARRSPYLVEFDRLPEEIQQYDVQSVMHIPAILQRLGYELYRMEESETLDDPELIERLARLVHAAYIKERIREGDTAETNPAVADYDDLPEDLRRANIDNAAGIPRKLKRLGCDLSPVRPGAEPKRLCLSAGELEQLSVLEHSRWMWQKILQGWTHAPGSKNIEQKTSPHLVPWAQLSEQICDYDRQTVRLIPDLLQQAGYEPVCRACDQGSGG